MRLDFLGTFKNSFSWSLDSLAIICTKEVHLWLNLLGIFFHSWICMSMSLSRLGKLSAIISLNRFSISFSFFCNTHYVSISSLIAIPLVSQAFQSALYSLLHNDDNYDYI